MILNRARTAVRSLMPARMRSLAWNGMRGLMRRSLHRATKQQALDGLFRRLCEIVPDIGDQYTTSKVETEYDRTVVRSLHAFQMKLAQEALAMPGLNHGRPLVVIDIGDSAGTHLRYLQALYPQTKLRCLSVNLDEEAVRKIQAKGLEAVCMRAEELPAKGIRADVLLCYETLEHLMDPIHFLKNLSDTSECEAFVVTVPYVQQSRVNLQHVRPDTTVEAIPENIHVFELSPDDWRRIFRHTGWRVVSEQTYLQYPRFGLLRLTKSLWKNLDFEGFWGAILVRDATWKNKYQGW